MNVGGWVDRSVDAGRGDAVAVIVDGGERLTWAELARQVDGVARALAVLGLGREQRVVLILDDTPAFPAAFLGAMKLGAVPVPANFLLKADDLVYIVDDSYAVAVIVDAALLGPEPSVLGPRPAELRERLAARPHVRVIVANGPGAELDAWRSAPVPRVPALEVHPEDMAFWLYSSGSTGRPKGVVHTHGNVAHTCRTYAEQVLETTALDRHYSTTKLFHAYGLGNGLTFPLWVGATAVYAPGRPTEARALEVIARWRPTLLFSVPTLYARMVASPDLGSTDFSSVRRAVSAAEPLPPETWSRFRDATGVEILDGIGSTEMLHIYCSNRAGEVRPGTSGRPVPGYRVEVRDEAGAPVGPGGSGELVVAGDSALAFYWHQRAKTRAALRGDWFHTGDRYRVEPDGVFAYEGRVDDMLKVGGLWVSPIEIENRLMEHPAVAEAAVVGIDVDGLTRIKAFVIARAVEPGLDDALREWCKRGLQRNRFPHEVEFVSDFPRTATGKVQRFLLRR
ncbi:MAG: benzoate-CoA ligase family protein [Myxococcota bacterium]